MYEQYNTSTWNMQVKKYSNTESETADDHEVL
jgi:hypothetical protein